MAQAGLGGPIIRAARPNASRRDCGPYSNGAAAFLSQVGQLRSLFMTALSDMLPGKSGPLPRKWRPIVEDNGQVGMTYSFTFSAPAKAT